MRAVICGIVMALMVTAAQAAEDPESANYILPGCRQVLARQRPSNFMVAQMMVCVGKVHSIFVVLKMRRLFQDSLDRRDPGGARSLCSDPPENVTPEQMIRVIVAYIEARPAELHKDFDWLATLALAEAWPCPLE
jgi:hypothetical protein